LRTLAHLSDLHFGRLDPGALPALKSSIGVTRPDVVVVSGDLTQRARGRQFAGARRFLDSLSVRLIVVPGNHDVPLYNVIARWLRPLAKYRHFISDDLEPFYADDEIAIAGINTARSLAVGEGRINQHQVERSCARLSRGHSALTRIIVTHHPFDVLGTQGHGGIVGRAAMAIRGFAECRVDLILSGHLHLSQTVATTVRYGDTGYSALLVQAGTATSSRRRGELNSYNMIYIDRPHVWIDRLTWDDNRGGFRVSRTDHFRLASDGWSQLPSGT
jgi:3',5'-cyclic AMP phosphodiesterase CpdA